MAENVGFDSSNLSPTGLMNQAPTKPRCNVAIRTDNLVAPGEIVACPFMGFHKFADESAGYKATLKLMALYWVF